MFNDRWMAAAAVAVLAVPTAWGEGSIRFYQGGADGAQMVSSTPPAGGNLIRVGGSTPQNGGAIYGQQYEPERRSQIVVTGGSRTAAAPPPEAPEKAVPNALPLSRSIPTGGSFVVLSAGGRGYKAVESLPRNAQKIEYIEVTYHYANGLFYEPYRQGNRLYYLLVRPPAGIIVRRIPEPKRKTVYDRREYYVQNEIYYERVMDRGQSGYRVVLTK